MAWYIISGWLRRVTEKTCITEKKKRESTHQPLYPPAFIRYMGRRLHAETGCMKLDAGEVFDE